MKNLPHHMDIQKYHNTRLEFHIPAVHEGYTPGDPVYAARGVASMTVSGSDVLLHPLEGSRFRPLSGLPFLHLFFPRPSSLEAEANTIFRAGPQPSYFGSMVEDGLHLVFDDTVDRSKQGEIWIGTLHLIDGDVQAVFCGRNNGADVIVILSPDDIESALSSL